MATKASSWEQPAFSFVVETEERERQLQRQKIEDDHRRMWRICWGWEGPKAGEPCDIHNIVVKLAEPLVDKGWYNSDCKTGTIYAYMERCILLEQRSDGTWLAEIAMGMVHGKPWYKDGTKVLLGVMDIWPPTRDLRGEFRPQHQRL